MAEYRIDDLARAAGLSVRNVRVYQDRGLLPPPRRAGRVGWYSDAHLGRLRLIASLLERGYTFAQITELVTAWEQGRDLADVLGLEGALLQPWNDEVPGRMTVVELRRMFGRQATKGAIERSVAAGLLQREGTGFRVTSPRLLEAGAELVAAGVPLAAVLDLAEALRGDLDVVARRFVAVFIEHVLGLDPAQLRPDLVDPARLAAVAARLRPLAQKAVEANLAQAMERQVTAVVTDAARRATLGRDPARRLGPGSPGG